MCVHVATCRPGFATMDQEKALTTCTLQLDGTDNLHFICAEGEYFVAHDCNAIQFFVQKLKLQLCS